MGGSQEVMVSVPFKGKGVGGRLYFISLVWFVVLGLRREDIIGRI